MQEIIQKNKYITHSCIHDILINTYFIFINIKSVLNSIIIILFLKVYI